MRTVPGKLNAAQLRGLDATHRANVLENRARGKRWRDTESERVLAGDPEAIALRKARQNRKEGAKRKREAPATRGKKRQIARSVESQARSDDGGGSDGNDAMENENDSGEDVETLPVSRRLRKRSTLSRSTLLRLRGGSESEDHDDEEEPPYDQPLRCSEAHRFGVQTVESGDVDKMPRTPKQEAVNEAHEVVDLCSSDDEMLSTMKVERPHERSAAATALRPFPIVSGQGARRSNEASATPATSRWQERIQLQMQDAELALKGIGYEREVVKLKLQQLQ
ncbi:hypothetical protein LTR15_012087 [Elasticomyces elasticus]|nr:hypothetical protein LTR15_012087 [Elasticomyces elasticus]